MTKTRIATGIAAATICLSSAGQARAADFQPLFGSVSGSTHRNCGTATATEACDGLGDGQRVVDYLVTGGKSIAADTDLTLADGSFARGSVTFGAYGLPVIHSETYAAGNERLNSNTFAYQSYTWNGTAPIAFSIAATLDVDDASTSGPAVGDVDGGVLPGGAGTFAGLLILDPSKIDGLTADTLFTSGVFGAECGQSGVLGSGELNATFEGAAHYKLATGACGAGDLMLQPGQTVLLAAELQLPVNRGGFAIATHTFTTVFDPALGTDVVSRLEANLTPATAVPEPGSWAMTIAGIGLAGAAIRRRRRSPPVVA